MQAPTSPEYPLQPRRLYNTLVFMLVAMLADANRPGERQRVAGPRIFLGRRDDPDIIAEFARDFFEHLEAGGVHAVVIGEKNTHQSIGSSRSSPAI